MIKKQPIIFLVLKMETSLEVGSINPYWEKGHVECFIELPTTMV